jgi:hypothetical protein
MYFYEAGCAPIVSASVFAEKYLTAKFFIRDVAVCGFSALRTALLPEVKLGILTP